MELGNVRSIYLAMTANQSLQATPTNASVSSLKMRAGLCHKFGVPELYR
jgi:hypothetical protein